MQYYNVKNAVFAAVPFGSEASHILLGFAVYLIALLVFRRHLRHWWAALPVLLVAAAMEGVDLFHGQRPLAAVHDLLLFAGLPLLTTALARLGWVR